MFEFVFLESFTPLLVVAVVFFFLIIKKLFVHKDGVKYRAKKILKS